MSAPTKVHQRQWEVTEAICMDHSQMQEKITRLDFKVLIYRDHEGVYIAQCLNYDLVTNGESISGVLSSLEHEIHTQIRVSLNDGIEPFSDFEQAPDEFWERYNTLGPEQWAVRFSTEFNAEDHAWLNRKPVGRELI